MDSRYSCNFAGQCEPDEHGRFASLNECSQVCYSRPQKDLNYLIQSFAPQPDYLAPSDASYTLTQITNLNFPTDYPVKQVLAWINDRDYPSIAHFNDPVLTQWMLQRLTGDTVDSERVTTALINHDYEYLYSLGGELRSWILADRVRSAHTLVLRLLPHIDADGDYDFGFVANLTQQDIDEIGALSHYWKSTPLFVGDKIKIISVVLENYTVTSGSRSFTFNGYTRLIAFAKMIHAFHNDSEDGFVIRERTDGSGIDLTYD